jgi:hypothetical protein
MQVCRCCLAIAGHQTKNISCGDWLGLPQRSSDLKDVVGMLELDGA